MEDGILSGSGKDIKSLLSNFIKFKLKLSLLKPNSNIVKIQLMPLKKIIRKELPQSLRKKPIDFVDHHLAHVASVYFTSGKNKILCITADGYGDGVSLTVNKCENGIIKRIFEVDAYDSFGLFYSLITGFLGFKQHRHEGKIVGLAAYGNPKNILLKYPFVVINGKIKYTKKFGFLGLDWLKEVFENCKKEDIAAWLQKNTEKYICEIVNTWCKKTGIFDVALAGGVFSNVKLNQRIHEIPDVKSIYIFPHMGDGGLAVGAALYLAKPHQKRQSFYPEERLWLFLMVKWNLVQELLEIEVY